METKILLTAEIFELLKKGAKICIDSKIEFYNYNNIDLSILDNNIFFQNEKAFLNIEFKDFKKSDLEKIWYIPYKVGLDYKIPFKGICIKTFFQSFNEIVFVKLKKH